MISHEHKCIFIHIPKTGGESVAVLLGVDPDPQKLQYLPQKHAGIRYYQKKFPKEFKTYFKFAIVRNPWAATISWAAWRDRVIKKNPPDSFSKEKFKYYMNHEFRKSFFAKKRPETMLFINGDMKMDFIVRFETINEDFEYVYKKLNITNKLPHKNRTKHKRYQEYYNDKMIDMVNDKFKNDIKYFKYNF